VSFSAITLCVASQRVFIVVVVYSVIDAIRKLLDIPSIEYNVYSHQVSQILTYSASKIIPVTHLTLNDHLI
jgi:hypothetical protein